MQEAMTEAGRQLPLLTLLLAAEPPESRSSTLGWRVQQRLSQPSGGPHAVSDGLGLGQWGTVLVALRRTIRG